MERKLNTERLYYLGNYKNIKISNELSNIPESFISDKVIDLLYTHQLLAIEKAYRQYHEIIKNLPADEAEVLEYLEAEKVQTLAELKAEWDKQFVGSKLITEEETK